MPANRNVTELETYTGQYVDLTDPDPATIRLEDIAVGLANTCRYQGQVARFYSVAEHAVRVSQMVPDRLALAALHHDSHEAYIGDIIAPLKKVLRDAAPNALDEIADDLDLAIFAALKIEVPSFADYHDYIKAADDEALYREAAALKWSHGVGPHWANETARVPWAGLGWSPARAERLFIQRHEELTHARDNHAA